MLIFVTQFVCSPTAICQAVALCTKVKCRDRYFDNVVAFDIASSMFKRPKTWRIKQTENNITWCHQAAYIYLL